MPKLTFTPAKITVEVNENFKILAAAVRQKLPIRYGCGACRCGTCAVAVSGDGILTEMQNNEADLLRRMRLALDGSVRLSCQAKIISGEINVDLDFQDTYEPEDQEEY